MTPEARDDRRLGVLDLTARTSLDRLPTTTRGALLGSPSMRASQRPAAAACGAGRCDGRIFPGPERAEGQGG